jgi:hypothetical protein
VSTSELLTSDSNRGNEYVRKHRWGEQGKRKEARRRREEQQDERHTLTLRPLASCRVPCSSPATPLRGPSTPFTQPLQASPLVLSLDPFHSLFLFPASSLNLLEHSPPPPHPRTNNDVQRQPRPVCFSLALVAQPCASPLASAGPIDLPSISAQALSCFRARRFRATASTHRTLSSTCSILCSSSCNLSLASKASFPRSAVLPRPVDVRRSLPTSKELSSCRCTSLSTSQIQTKSNAG